MPELSIILPVYKMEKFLPRVIASIKAQTMRDFEAIFVDDGSPDNSGAICLASAADDSRFRVITRENGGVSKARNTALDAATGEYVMFVDPDDWIEPDAAEVLVGMAKNHNADIVLYGRHNDRYSSDGTFVGTSLSKPPITGVFTDEPFRTHFSALATSYFITDKLMKRSFIEEHHCRFPDMDLGEDGAFYISFYSADPSCLVATERAFYHYTVPESGSLSTSYHPERLKYADTVIFLKYPRALCLRRVLKRYLDYRGRTRPDLTEGCPERLNFEFLRYIWTYNRKMLPRMERYLKEAGKGCRLYVFDRPEGTEAFLRCLKQK